jgi:hypothetical protein
LTPEALKERYTIGGLFLLGKVAFRQILDEHFGGQVPEPGTGAWVSFVFAVSEAPHNLWLRTWGDQGDHGSKYSLPIPKMPEFPKALENIDHFSPYNAYRLPPTEAQKARGEEEGDWNAGQRATNIEPFWIGFWTAPEIRNPYRHADNFDAFENGRALSKTKHAETYKKYVAACRQVCRKTWGEGTRVP